MKLVFIGTRGEIEPKTKRHSMHTSLLILSGKERILIDCGASWLKRFRRLRPTRIVLTHAHPDHAWGLKNGAPCPVWATKETWKIINSYPIEQKKRIEPRRKKRIGGVTFEAFPVFHSLICPAVGYRICLGKIRFFYVPDVAYIPNIQEAFSKIDLYIGDGATVEKPFIRKDKKSGKIFGHTTVRQQLSWCKKQGVKKMIVTHCGREIVSREKQALKTIEKLAEERGVCVKIAYDGMKIALGE